jgi:hypothetical protein
MPPEFDFFLGGHGFMLQEGGASVASVNNPPGLSTAGGNVLREYGQWTEDEWADFSNGAGQRTPANNGFLHSSGDTLRGGWRLQQQIYKEQILAGVAPGIATQGAFFAEYNGYVLLGVDNKLFVVERDAATFAPSILSTITFNIYGPDNLFSYAWPFSWKEIDQAEPWFPLEGGTELGTPGGNDWRIEGTTLKSTFRITGMCIFGDYLALAITGYQQGPFFSEWYNNPLTPNMLTPPGLYLVDLSPLKSAAPLATQPLKMAATGYFAYDPQAEPFKEDWTADDPDWIETVGRVREPYAAVGCTVIGGLLFFWSGNGVFYTNGLPHHDFDRSTDKSTAAGVMSVEPTAAANWGWYATLLKSASNDTRFVRGPHGGTLAGDAAHAERITGMVALQGMTVSEKVTYVATTHGLYALITDEFFSVTRWGEAFWYNGLGCIEHQGDAYFPVGTGLVRVTPTGQVVQMGLDHTPTRAYKSVARHANALLSVRGALFSGAEVPLPTDTVSGSLSHNVATRGWVFESQGWHPLMSRHPGEAGYDDDWMMVMQGAFYHGATRTLWFVTSNGHPEVVNVGLKDDVVAYCATFPERMPSSDTDIVRYYAPTGWLVLPPFDAGALALQKDWNSVAVYGACFSPGSTIECLYRLSNGIASAEGCAEGIDQGGVHYANTGWTSLGVKTFVSTTHGLVEWRWPLPRANSSLAVELKFRVTRGSVSLSPHIQAIRLQHHDSIKDYFRFNLSVNLPAECLHDACRVLVPGYDRDTYDAWVRDAVCSEVPVSFVDVDGHQYYVRVETASRRTTPTVVPTTGQRSADIVWSLVLSELHPDSLCDL